MTIDPNTLSVLLGISANFATNSIITIWNKAKSYLTPKTKQTAELIEQNKEDDTTVNQRKELKAEFEEILKKPELVELLKQAHNEASIHGNNNIVIQGSTINQTNQGGGDNVIGSKDIHKE